MSYSNEWTTRGNAYFEAFYKGLGIVPEEEWESFMNTANSPLPVSFRVTGFRREAKTMLEIIEKEYLSRLEVENSTCDAENKSSRCDFVKLPWYPDGLAFQLQMDRKTIRRSPAYQRFHEMLVSETEAGGISRQETVSMLPPLVLDVKPGHSVIDMCAAPGSKTCQILEMLHQDEQSAGMVLAKSRGFVIANDTDPKRCQLMVHQLKRLQSPLLCVVCHDASTFPSLRVAVESNKLVAEDVNTASINSADLQKKTEPVFFDRVLCDVPCSGDGTVRKNPVIWRRWSLMNGVNLHRLQVRILRRGLELLRSDGQGRLVYSTCSLNPAENEAVVANILQTAGDSVRVVDISGRLPGLKTRPGMTNWRYVTQDGVLMKTAADVPAVLRRSFPNSVFCPENMEASIAEQLKRCIRILPHDNDTGGFFVAVFEKTGKLGWQRSTHPLAQTEEATQQTSDDSAVPLRTDSANSQQPAANCVGDDSRRQQDTEFPPKRARYDAHRVGNLPKKIKKAFLNEAPLMWLSENSEDWIQIRDFFKLDTSGVDGTFIPPNCLCSRTESGRRRVFFLASPRVREIIQQNEHMRPIAIGLRCFARSSSPNSPCDFRICQDSVYVLRPYLRNRIVDLGSKKDATLLLSSENPYSGRLSSTVNKLLETVDIGTCIFRLYQKSPSEQGVDGGEVIVKQEAQVGDGEFEVLLAGWRGKATCRVFVAKYERSHFLRLCGIHSNDRSGKFSSNGDGEDGKGNEGSECGDGDGEVGDDKSSGDECNKAADEECVNDNGKEAVETAAVVDGC